MNIEKSIEILKEFRNYNKFYKEENKDLTITITLEAKESIGKAIERLLTAYEKEKALVENHKLAFEKQTENLHEVEELYEKEKEKNKIYSDVICRVRNLSSGVVSYDIIEGKKYYGPRKNFSKQRLYEKFLNIGLILKGNYIFLTNEKFLKELIEKINKEE